MIIGTGSDMIDIRRIDETIARFGMRFIKRCFTAAEIERAESQRPNGTHINSYAKRRRQGSLFQGAGRCASDRRHLLGRHFHAQVAARHHHRVGFLDDAPRLSIAVG